MRARFVKAVQAGVDQFGGTEDGDMLVEAVRAGELAEASLDESVAARDGAEVRARAVREPVRRA